jgi:cell division protein FtsL
MSMSTTRRRSIVTATFFILFAVLIATYPLIMVGTQVYITSAALKQESVADSIAVLRRETARLRMEVERLSSTGRIETICHGALGLEYPLSENIVIIGAVQDRRQVRRSGWRLLTVIKRSLHGGRG